MADAIISVVVERVADTIEKQIQDEVDLVRDVDMDVLNLSHELKKIRNVLDDAERRGFKENNINDWLMRLEDTSYEMDDVLDEWNAAILQLKMEHSNSVVAPQKKVRSFISSSCLFFKKLAMRHGIVKKLENVEAQLDLILAEKDQYDFLTSQPTDPSSESWRVQSNSLVVHGRDSDREVLVSKLMPNSDFQKELGPRILSVVGVGGVGKTTLARLIYSDSRVEKCFGLRIWICVSDPFNEARIAKDIIESVERAPNTNEMEMLLQCLKETVSRRKFLLVLDDVWMEDSTKWEPLKNTLKYGRADSVILVTTRNERVAITMGTVKEDIYHLGQLSHEDCWLLFHRIAFLGKTEEECVKLQDIGKKIANKCNGLPLAATVLGSLLCFKNNLEEWENVLQSEIWQLEEAKVELFPHLLLSYNELSPALKRCFSYCAVFPKDCVINVEKLIRKWMALGYLGSNGSACEIELRGQQYFENLAMRSLFQDFDQERSSFKMHDIIHDFAQFLRKNNRVDAGIKKTTCKSCSPLLAARVKEYRSLLICYKEPTPQIKWDCLTSLRVLSLTYRNRQSMPLEIEKLIHLRWLDLDIYNLSMEELKIICKLYNLQFLSLSDCGLKELPGEIGNLIHLRCLDLSGNWFENELPESICNLRELRTLSIANGSCRFPQGIHRLVNLKHLIIGVFSSEGLTQGLAQLTGLHTLKEFTGGRDGGKFGWLRNLNWISGSLTLNVAMSKLLKYSIVEDAREAELRKKTHIHQLKISFSHSATVDDEKQYDSVIDALEPHRNLLYLIINNFKGSKLPDWIISPLNQLRSIYLKELPHLSSLPPLGKLLCLEEIEIYGMDSLEFLGREFLGIPTTREVDVTSSSSSTTAAANTNTIAFPKLKRLEISGCPNWKEWEDITIKEEHSSTISLMPCLKELCIGKCDSLTALPHCLLRKASSLEILNFWCSGELQRRYKNKEGSAWQSISRHNPGVRFWYE